ncbi:methionine--tRNA ligase [Patescibacteria group bacterium]|nr:methionine--tRNA ligase [Patescibacteria group bacterium]
MAKNKKFYITTPIYYVNAKPHIGHAYTTITADIFARYHRMRGEEVFFLTGTDEHGAKIQQIADKAKKSPKEFVDEISAAFSEAWDVLNITNDNFIRTTDPAHEKAVADVTQKLFDKKFIYKGKYEALYCIGCEQYKTKAELVDGKCPDHKCEPEIHTEEAYLFRMSKFQNELLKLIKSDKLKISPETRKNEMISFYEKEGLKDVAISRRKEVVPWGIELPFDRDHTLYVWIDAFLNYLTGLGWPKDKKLYKKFWPANLQLMSKDILRVHATIWPAMLLAMGEKLPDELFIHGYFTIDGQKMSKSLGNVIDPVELAQKYGVDEIRYFLSREISFGEDGDFSFIRLEGRYNADLANGLGNLVARVLAMCEKYFDGKTPEKTSGSVERTWQSYEINMEKFAPHLALKDVWDLIAFCDQFINTEAPWQLAKVDKERLSRVIYTLLETIRHIAWLITPFMPMTSDKIFEQLGLKPETEKKKSLEEAKKWGGLVSGGKIKKGAALFPRLEK